MGEHGRAVGPDVLVEAQAADKTEEEERTKALDPALSPDPKAARQAMEDAAFTRDRLKTLLPRLEARYRDRRSRGTGCVARRD